MLFSKYLTLAFASMAAVASGSDVDTVVTNIQSVTQLSQNLQVQANGLNLLSILLGQSTVVVTGFTGIFNAVTNIQVILVTLTPLSIDSDRQKVVAVLTDFVQVHQALLNIVIGKAGAFSLVPYLGDPIAEILRQLEEIIDSVLAQFIIFVGGSEASGIKSQQNGLDITFGTAISAYSNTGILGKRHNADRAPSGEGHHVDDASHHAYEKRHYVDAPSGAVLASARVNNKRSAEEAHGAGSVWRSVWSAQ